MALVVQTETPKASWVRYMHQRIRQNKNALLFISGPTGSGKSWSSLSIAEQIDPEFTIDRVVFSGIELMELITDGDLKKGSVIIFEEVGVELSSKNWQSTTNKMINFLMQTFRHRCFVLIMNSPYMDFVDASTRKLFHAELNTVNINRDTGTCRLRPQLIQYNGRYSKFYYKYLRVVTKDGVVPIKFWSVVKPSDDLLQQYEKRKRGYTDRLNKEIWEELRAVKDKNKKDKDTMKCNHCNYKWKPRKNKEDVIKCPGCRKNPH